MESQISVLGHEAPARQGERHPRHWQVGRLHSGRDQTIQVCRKLFSRVNIK